MAAGGEKSYEAYLSNTNTSTNQHVEPITTSTTAPHSSRDLASAGENTAPAPAPAPVEYKSLTGTQGGTVQAATKYTSLIPPVEALSSSTQSPSVQNRDTAVQATSHASSILPTVGTDPTAVAGVRGGNGNDSHALAEAQPEKVGVAQQVLPEEEDVKDLGWNEDMEEIAEPLIGGLPNEDLWLLVRRFNKQVFHVKTLPRAPSGGLDMNIADEDEFSPDKMRGALERMYMTIIVGMMAFVKHIARLRSWNERRRTGIWAATYFVAWAVDFTMPLLFLTMIVLVAYPPSRDFLFPPAPMALVDAKTGGLKNPTAGVLGSESATGAPEKHEGEAVEQEASNFVSGIASIGTTVTGLSSAKTESRSDKKEDGTVDKRGMDPTSLVMGATEATQKNAKGDDKSHDKTKEPVEQAMWSKVRPVMHGLGDATDGWERFANALSPTPPFPQSAPRLRLAGVLLPALLGSLFTSSYMVVKGTTFAIGFGFFGQPLLDRGLAFINRRFPNWQKLLELRNTLLKGIPTNAQLTVTLLRVGEANRAPLPPPPRSDTAPPDQAALEKSPTNSADRQDLAGSLGADPHELSAAVHPDPQPVLSNAKGENNLANGPEKTKKSQKFLNFFKSTVKVGTTVALSSDKLKAKSGSEHSKNRLGVLPDVVAPPPMGPVDFPARLHGKKGTIYISSKTSPPTINFVYSSTSGKVQALIHPNHRDEQSEVKAEKELQGLKDGNVKPEFSVAIPDIKELRKVGGLNWAGKLVVGWAMDTTVEDGLEIVDSRGNKFECTAIRLREELFNRLVAMGNQNWEMW